MLQTAGCLVYSLGSAGDTSFEEVMINRTACSVHTFDPTLSAEQQTAVQSKDKLHFYPIGEPILCPPVSPCRCACLVAHAQTLSNALYLVQAWATPRRMPPPP